MSEDTTVLVWMDVETDGLDPSSNLLQVAAILTDVDGNELADPFEAIVYYDADTVEAIKATTVDVVVEMHTVTGLWDRLSSDEALPLETVDQMFHDYIAGVAPKTRQAQFAGNSVRFDMNWAEVHLPKSYRHCHYRSIDVTAISTTLVRWGVVAHRFDGEFEGDKHNAVADIRHAVREYRWLREQVSK